LRRIFRTIRQRGRRAQRGQVSAVATVLGLLLVVTYLSNYLVFQLPGQMSQAEFQHVVEVENQLERFQATVIAQSSARGLPFALSNPVTLGSAGVPPFGGPALGSIGPEQPNVGAAVSYVLDTVIPATPDWGLDSSCLPNGAGHCAGNGNVNYANVSANGTSYALDMTGGNNSVVYNLNGNNDSITITWSGKDMGVVAFVINGSYDSVTFNKKGSDTSTPSVLFYFFGTHDSYSMSMSGSHSSVGGMFISVRFVGIYGYLCPYDNSSATDSIGTLGSGGSKLNLTVSWWNADGYVSSPHVTTYPGGTPGQENVVWRNQTGFVDCPFLQIIPASHGEGFPGGVQVNVVNHYLPPAFLGYEAGAVMLENPGDPAIMISPPAFSFNETLSGLTAWLVIPELSGNLTAESGTETASLTSRVVSVDSSTFGLGVRGLFIGTPYYVNLTTEFPAAWINYFDSQGQAFPLGATCKVIGAPLPSGYTCVDPPVGTAVKVSAPLFAQQVTLTILQVAVSIE
jgi:hypothetical protein